MKWEDSKGNGEQGTVCVAVLVSGPDYKLNRECKETWRSSKEDPEFVASVT